MFFTSYNTAEYRIWFSGAEREGLLLRYSRDTAHIVPLCDVRTLQFGAFQAAVDDMQWHASGSGLVHSTPLFFLKCEINAQNFTSELKGPRVLQELLMLHHLPIVADG